jgi:hypothetical protein
MPGLDETIRSYQECKDRFFRQYRNEQSAGLKRQMNFDKNITFRMNQIMKSYDSEVIYAEEDLKNMFEQAQHQMDRE